MPHRTASAADVEERREAVGGRRCSSVAVQDSTLALGDRIDLEVDHE
jgi:hypothetical protein